MTRQIQAIPAHLQFDGTIPTEAAHQVLGELVAIETEPELTEWQKARIGKITASRFGDVKYLKGSDKWGETANTYLYDLLGEHLTGLPAEHFSGNRATDWGEQYEPEALAAYTKRTGRKTKPAGFIQDPVMPFVGGTPDAFCGEKGLIEVKCPLTFKNHLRTVMTREVPEEYKSQVLGHLMLSGRDWCDFVSYDPRITGAQKIVIVRVRAEEQEAEMKALAARIIAFHELLVNNLKRLKIKPYQP